ncbi:protein S100-G-like [Epinephelus moara]|uniref:protein S100-G-like n=1 Tax=Epinephelus moara TaxID=300413 RepID=UPI00214F0E29|nr:protein S100-G-like [Epinephelus moara]
MERELSCLEVGLMAMLGVFMSNENEDGKITKEQFMRIMEGELPALLQRVQNRDNVFKRVDENEDGRVDFEEFAKLLAGFAKENYDDIKMYLSEEQQKAK